MRSSAQELSPAFSKLLVLPSFLEGADPEVVKLITSEHRRLYQQGDVLCREGEAADHLYLILAGVVDVSAGGESLVQRGPGEIVGEQAFIEGQPRGATVTAIGQVEVLRLPHPLVERLLDDRSVARGLLKAMSAKLSEATRHRAVRYARERLLFTEFSAHVAPEVAQRLAASGADYGKPRQVDALILFSDIRSFTDTSAAMEPETLASELTRYFDRVVDVIHAHGGVVDKFIGDAVMAFWGGFDLMAPEDRATRAFACAREMVRVASEATLGGRQIRIGVGLNAGRVFMGNVGGNGKRQFTVLGTAVNLAARFESQAKELDAPIVIGADVAARLSDLERRSLEQHAAVPIKGAAPQTLFTWRAAAPAGKEDA